MANLKPSGPYSQLIECVFPKQNKLLDFLKCYSPHLIRLEEDYWENLFNWQKYNSALEITPIELKDIELVKEARLRALEPLKLNTYNSSLPFKDKDNLVDKERLKFEINENSCSLKVKNAHSIITELQVFAKDLGRFYNKIISINCYHTPNQQFAYPVHTDNHDIFVLQIEGSKCWQFESKEITEQKIVLEKGDLLFIPRGLKHHAKTLQQNSLHLSVGLHELNYRCYVEAILNKPELSELLYSNFSIDESTGEINREEFSLGVDRVCEALQKGAEQSNTLKDLVTQINNKKNENFNFKS